MGNTVWGHRTQRFLVEVELSLRAPDYPSLTLQGTATVKAGAEVERRYNRIGRRPIHSVKVANFSRDVSGGIVGEFQIYPALRLLQLGVFFEAGATFETTDLLPLLAQTHPVLYVFVPLLDLYGRFTVSADGAINLWDSDRGEFTFRQGDLTLSFAGSLAVGADRRYTIRRFVEAWVEGGARPFVWLQYPGSSENASYFWGVPFLHQAGVEFFVQGSLRASLFGLDWEVDLSLINGRFVYPDWGGYLGVPVWLGGLKGGWRPPDRSYLLRDYHRVVAGQSIFPADDNWDVREERLIENIHPFASPSLTWKGDRAAIVYVYDDPNLPANQFAEIRALHQQADGSWQDVNVTQDTLLDSQPVIGQDSTGRLIAVWTRLKEEVAENEPPEARMTKAEIAYAVYDEASGTWSAPVLLTDDALIDLNPQLVQGADGALYLVWLKSPDNVFPTDFANPVVPHTDIWIARWDGNAFVDAQVAVARADTLEVAMAVNSAGNPILVWSADRDGDAVSEDGELRYTYWTGSAWAPIERVWQENLPQSSPAMSIGTNGVPVLYFVRSGLEHSEFEDHEQEELGVTSFNGTGWRTPLSITRANRFSDLNVISLPDGRVSALWVSSSTGVADLWTVVYDPATGYWSNPVQLSQDDMTQEVQVSAAWDPAGNPSAVYLKQRLEHQDRQVQDQHGNWYTVQVTVPVASDLYLLSHRPKPDLAILEGDLTLEPSNPGPGQQVTIQARVRNLRALGAANVQVRFYDGDPDAGGVVIATRPVSPDPITGGGMGLASVVWTVPEDGRAHVIYARVDPDNAIAETNEQNNTASYPVALLDLEALAPAVEQYLPDGQVRLAFGIRNPSSVTPGSNVAWQLRRDSPDGALIAEGAVPAPAAGQTTSLTYTWNPGNLNTGRYPLYLVIDPSNRFAESDEQNNAAEGEVALLPDLVLNPTLSAISLSSGGQATVETTLQNLGWSTAQNIVVQVLDGPAGVGNVLASTTVANLGRYENTHLTFTVSLSPGIRRIWLEANPQGTVQEVRRDNNTVILLVPWREGDTNGDGCVDDADLLAVLFAFGQSGSGLPEDVNNDGIVDDADLLIVLFNFGSGC
jgi:hypothetical protein